MLHSVSPCWQVWPGDHTDADQPPECLRAEARMVATASKCKVVMLRGAEEFK